MKTDIEYKIDDHTVLVGVLHIEEQEFDHEFGTEKLDELDFESASVITYINNIDYDVTSSIPEATLSRWKQQAIDSHMKMAG